MNYKILPTEDFKRDIRKLDPDQKARIKNKIEKVSVDPTRYKHLSYDLNGSCRLRVGKYRVIFSYDVNKRELYLEKVIFGHKY